MGAESSKQQEAIAGNKAFASIANFHPGYVLKLKERFTLAKEASPSPYTLDKEDLQELFKSSAREADIIFEHFDQNGDGVIDQYEFTTGLAFLSHGSLVEKAELIFNLYDFDKSKYISYDELTILMTNSLTALRALAKGPAPSLTEIERKTKEVFKRADLDGNEKITLEEFTSFVRRDNEVLQCLLGYGVAKTEDLGEDLGAGEGDVLYDSDLENEIGVRESANDEKKAGAKYGMDFEVGEDEDGGLFAREQEATGDQFMAVKPWKGTVESMVPSRYVPTKYERERPDASLDLEYIYGYRCHDARNNLRYTSDGKIVYHAAGVGVVLSHDTNTQQFMLEHDDDILCLATDPSGQYCATGQVGPKPWLCIWDTSTMECLARYRSPLVKGIKCVAFSNDGNKVVASGMDDAHSLAIFQWRATSKPRAANQKADQEKLGLLATGKGPRAPVWSLGFSPDGNQIVATCTRELNFYTITNGVLKGQRGSGWKQPPGAIPCQAFVEDTLYTGTHDGYIVEWAGQTVAKGKEIKAHESLIYAMSTRTASKGLVTGGKDGKAIVWAVNNSGHLVQELQYDLRTADVKSMNPQVKSVAEHPKTRQVLVGTRGGEIMEFGSSRGEEYKNAKPKVAKVLLKSHFDQELWGLATRPDKAEFLTVGRDGVLGVWDIATRRQTRYAKLECGADAAAYSNTNKAVTRYNNTKVGHLLAVGMRNGYLLVVDENFAPVAKTQHSKTGHAISVIKFSHDDSICAVAGHDGRVRLYDVASKFRKATVIKKNTSAVTHLDFSADGRYLMTNSLSYEVLFFDAKTGKHISKCSGLRDEKWFTWSCTFGWPVQGIFPANSDGSDVNACARSPDGAVVATGDDFGRVNLYRFPCPQPKTACSQSIGHSAHVTSVAFSAALQSNAKNQNQAGGARQHRLLSTGGGDLCIFQWRYSFGDGDIEDEAEDEQLDQAGAGHEDVDQFGFSRKEEEEEGDQALAVKPFVSAVQNSKPSDYKAQRGAGKAPEANLRLRRAHGFRCHDTRGNLKYTSDGRIVYTTAALGVVQDRAPRKTEKVVVQEFFDLHQDDVVALAIHPNRNIVATGQMAAQGRAKMVDVFVWDVSSQQVLAQLTGFHRRAVNCLQFSPKGGKLLTIGQDDQHSAAIYDWANQVLLSTVRTGPDKVLSATWKTESEFMTVGPRAAQFFTITGKNISAKKGTLGQLRSRAKQHLCCTYAFGGAVCLTGNETGAILEWKGTALKRVHQAHSAAVWQIMSIEEQMHPQHKQQVISGGSDGRLVIWGREQQEMKQLRAIDLCSLGTISATRRPEVTAIDFDQMSKTLLVGTRGAEVLEVSSDGQGLGVHVRGHFAASKSAELWGAACHPTEQFFATCGADRLVRIWDTEAQVACSSEFKAEIFAIDWSPCGRFLVVGDAKGQVHSIDAASPEVEKTGQLKVVSTIKHGSKVPGKEPWVQDVKISPDAKLVAFGVHGGNSNVELATVDAKSLRLRHTGSIDVAMHSALLHLDWSQDSKLLALNSQAYELLFLDVAARRAETASAVKDVAWSTWTCKFGFPVQGIWPGVDYTDVNAVARSHSARILATAEDSGLVKLFQYPCTQPKAAWKEHRGHSSHVTRVAFSAQDRYLVSVGGADKTVLIWETDFGAEKAHIDQHDEEPIEEVGADDEDELAHEQDLVDQSDVLRVRREARHVERKKAAERAAGQYYQNEDADDQEALDLFQKYEDHNGDELLAAKPWKGQVRAPAGFTKAPKNQDQAPRVSASIDWVYGYRGYKTKNNLRYLADGSIVYHTAGLGVVYDQQMQTQRHFDKHTDDVTAMAVSSDRKTVATGEVGKKPKIYVWDAISMQVLRTFSGNLQRGIKCMSFSQSGELLAAVDVSDNRQIAVYNVKTGVCVATARGDKAPIIDICFHLSSNPADLQQNGASFATAGVKHFKFWTLGKSLTSKNAIWGKRQDRNVGCIAYYGAPASGGRPEQSLLISGTSQGSLIAWKGNTIVFEKRVHGNKDKGYGIDAIHIAEDRIITGGRDGKVNILSVDASSFSVLFTIDLSDCKSVKAEPRAIDLDPEGHNMIIGTAGNEIYEIGVQLSKQKSQPPVALVQGHYCPKNKDTNEVWGLCAVPGTDRFISVSDDATLRVWSASTRKQLECVDLNRHSSGQPLPADPKTKELDLAAQARSIDVSADGSVAAVGFRSGQVKVYKVPSAPGQDWKLVCALREPITQDKEKGASWIEDLKFSPDSRYLAVSSHDKRVYVFCIHYSAAASSSASKPARLELFCTLKGSTSYVCHLDWSADSRCIRTNDGSYELLHYVVNAGDQSPQPSTSQKDTVWATHTCPISWATQGIWAAGYDGTDINHCDVSAAQHADGYQLLATADDFGKVKLFRYPSPSESAKALTLRGHSSHVTKVKFGDAHGQSQVLFSTGGNDTTVIQWKIDLQK